MQVSRLICTCCCLCLCSFAPVLNGGTCHHAYIAEGQAPPAVDGISTTETGFTSYLWAWGSNPSDQGSMPVGLVDDGSGIAINPGFLWANSGSCSGEILGSGLLIEAQTTDSGGKLALVVLGAEGQVDKVQESTGQSVAQVIPVPALSTAGYGTDAFGDYVDFILNWSAPSGDAWVLSALTPVLAGYSVLFRTEAAVNNGDKAAFTRVGSVGGTTPYITNDSDTNDGLLPASQTSCQVRLRYGTSYYFVLSLLFDGSGSGGDPQAAASAVETTYVSARWLVLNSLRREARKKVTSVRSDAKPLTAGVSGDTLRINGERQPRRGDFIAGRSRMSV